MVTIKDIKKGMMFCQPGKVSPHNEIMTVVDIEYNPKAGEDIKDMWGGSVWAEPLATIYAVGEITKERRGFTVQSDNSDLSSWLTFINSPEERIEAIYADRKKDAISIIKRNMPEIIKALQEIPKYPAQLKKDDDMKQLIELVGRAAVIVF